MGTVKARYTSFIMRLKMLSSGAFACGLLSPGIPGQ